MVRYSQHANEKAKKKLLDKFDGFFFITRIINLHIYKFELSRDWTIHPVFHMNLFRAGSTDPLPGQLTPPPVLIIDENGQNTWEVTRTLNFKMFKNKLQFLVNWVKNRPDWQLFENVIGTFDVLNQDFNKYCIRPGYDGWNNKKSNILTNYKISLNSIIKIKGSFTVRTQFN